MHPVMYAYRYILIHTKTDTPFQMSAASVQMAQAADVYSQGMDFSGKKGYIILVRYRDPRVLFEGKKFSRYFYQTDMLH